MQQNIIYENSSVSQSLVARFMYATYLWMGIGLCVTGFVAMAVASMPSVLAFFYYNRIMLFGVLIAEIGLVFYLASHLMKMEYSKARNLFLVYAVLNGISMAGIFIVYTGSSISSTFLVTAGTFGIMCLYGYITKTDLSRFGNILFMGLIGIIVASFANMFFASSGFSRAITYIGVLLFCGITAYDTQYLKRVALSTTDETALLKLSLYGALKLYLDFINMFMFMLRLMSAGGRD